jgi:hypothetical protein
MKPVTRLTAVLAAWLISAAAYASVNASVDNDQVAPGATIELTLSRDGRTGSNPDLAPLDQDFDVLSMSTGSNVQIINGRYSFETQVRLTLSPKRSGQLTIPSLTWNNESSAPIRITVIGGGKAQPRDAQTQSSNVFLRATVDDSQPYVQGGVHLTVRLYAAAPLYRASLELPDSSDVLVQQLGKDRKDETEIDGRLYQVVERHYLLFPQHSGAITVPGPVLDAQVRVRSRDDPFSAFFGPSPFADLMGTAKPIRIHADDIALVVRPRPQGATTSYWIPAKNLNVTSEWRPENLEVHAGEPVTLDMHLSAEGLTAAQLPDIASLLNLPAGLKAYPDQPRLDNSAQNGTLVGRRDQSVALIADEPGNFTLPAIHVQWWDTNADQLREAQLPARTLKVLPAVGGTPRSRKEVVSNSAPHSAGANSAPRSTAFGVSPWQWVSISLAALWIGTMLAWWLSGRRAPTAIAPHPAPAAQPNESQARDRFLAACKRNDARTARRALLERAQAKWPESPPGGLRALASRLDDANVDALLIELDRACYAGGEWNGSALAQALDKLPSTPEKKKAGRAELAELYP